MAGDNSFQRIREKLLCQEPFFASFALRMEWEFSDKIPTAATDGARILWNKVYWDSLTEPQRIGVSKHEVEHIVYKDHLYRNGKDFLKWNIATDHRINLQILDVDGSLPDGRCADKKYKGMTGEEIYRKLPEQKRQKGVGDSEDSPWPSPGHADTPGQTFPGDVGQVMDAPGSGEHGMSEAEREAASREIDGRIIEAAKAARQCGKGSNFADRLVDAIRRGTVDWRSELRPFFTTTARDGQSWERVQRRGLWRGLYLPGTTVPACQPVGVVVDTSGSVGREELSAFLGEIESLLLAGNGRAVLIAADAEVHGVPVEVGREDIPLRWVPKGGGGTDFRPAIAWCENHRPDLGGIIYLTDCYGGFPKSTHVPVLWVCVSDAAAPASVGRTVRMRL